jgi:hypothetical protein
MTIYYQLIYDEFISPGARIPGMKPVILNKFILMYKSMFGLGHRHITAQLEKYGNVIRTRKYDRIFI